ncbi:hypothetical protein KUTeg_020398 [Tegillarca granosa]|uniref:Uncharacterized protein n=1 Tax=Tegillarca granosa TaxID=220873 RepID=A0ABQ9EAJ0_TEGGR|nr:hypothetical protein KUTeg_020398 [Tegillarca granosa]
MMRCVLFLIIALPWLIRVYVYFEFEDAELDERNFAANKRNLRPEFLGSITLFLTPIHMLFLVCYFILLIDGIAFGVLTKTVKEKFKYVLRKCFRDMREISRSRVCGWTTKLMLLPFEHCGITGLFVIAFYWVPALPVVLTVLSFYWFPTLNLTVRLLAHFFAYLVPYGKESPCFRPIFACCSWIYSTFSLDIIADKESLERPEKITMRYRFLQLFVILICLISMYSVVFLAMECISFFVEVGVYTLIGIILNASQTLKYLSLLFMLVLYGRDCFNGVGNIYLTFNQKILGYVVSKATDEVKALTWLCESQQNNTAIRILPEKPGNDCQNNDKPTVTEAKLKIKEGIPKWELSHIALFLDKKDTSYITRKFFFITCYMPHHGCPGSLYKNLLKALTSFAMIILFLLFVLFVVMAFSEDYSLSGTNQMLATLAGGLLPWLFRNILLKKPEEVTVDTTNLHFQNCFNQELKQLIQSWPVADFECEVQETENKEPQTNGKNAKSRRNQYKYRTDNVTGSQIYDSADFETIGEMLPMLSEEENDEAVEKEKVDNKNDVGKIDLIIDIAKEIDSIKIV